MSDSKVIEVLRTKKPEIVADFLMWVGSIHYPTVDIYIEEARRMGVCKRMGKLPHNLKPGKSKVFLAHDDGLNGDGFIFGYFIPDRIEYLTKNEEDIPDTLYDRIEWVSYWENEESRECGDRHEGMYAVARFCEDDEAEPTEKLVIFDKPRKLQSFDKDRKHFRGLLQIAYGEKVINAKKHQTMTPPSRKAHKPIDPDTPWSEKEDANLIFAMENGKSRSRAAQEIAYATGRPKSSVLYHYSKLTGDIDGEEETEE